MDNFQTIKNGSDLVQVLGSSLYVGAQEESIKLVLGYCKAANLDPMQKPVHIVPMYCATGEKDSNGKDIKAMRDVIMPGIGLYRIQAARSGELAGISEPEYGEDITEEIDGSKITYPSWCRVTVKRTLSNGALAEFTAREFWKENYATQSRDSKKPNSMWSKRPYAQIAKCAEAQALRKAFPEVGAQPTVDEMEGKEIDISSFYTLNVTNEEDKKDKAIPYYPTEKFNDHFSAWKTSIESGKKTAKSIINQISTQYILSEEQKEKILNIGAIDGNS